MIGGHWRLLELLGTGATGDVWRAEGPRGPAAVKILRADVDSEEMRSRFEREAQALREVNHPNLVRAFDFGRQPEGEVYLAMELLEGETLEDRLERDQCLAPSAAVHIAHQVASALAAAHAAGIVHRDVKPSNIFLCLDGRVKVIDFGLAIWTGVKQEPADALGRARLTQTGGIVGTPSYMAPEQATGQREEDPRTDVWALGATLFDAVSGSPPFGSSARSAIATLTRIVMEPPDPLPDDLPDELSTIILRALKKSPKQRFKNMTAMADALETLLPQAWGSPATTRQTSFTEEARLVVAVIAVQLRDAGLERFVAAVTAEGGTASALRGGNAVAIFGGGQWLGDEPLRAVRTALLARDLAQYFGIGTGKAVRGSAGEVTGDVVTAAFKAFEDAAQGASTLQGEQGAVVAVCPETQRSVERAFVLDGSCVLAEKHGQHTSIPRAVGGIDVPFVGRELALAQLTGAVDRTTQTGAATRVHVVGPPGIGKTRLCLELRRWLDDHPTRFQFLEVRCEPNRSVSAYAALAGALRKRAQVPRGLAPTEARHRIETMVQGAHVKNAQLVGEIVCAMLGVPDAQPVSVAPASAGRMAERLALGVGDLFEAWCRRGPLVLLVEDLQWLDDGSAALFERLLVRLQAQPLCLVTTCRPSSATRHAELLSGVEEIALGELSKHALGVIVERVLGRPDAKIVRRAAGNPYFAEELSLAMRQGTSRLPLTVEGAVQARLDALGKDAKDLLKRAAVLGQQFWVEALGALGATGVDRALSLLHHHGLVQPRHNSRLSGHNEWQFQHRVVSQVCKRMLTDPQRRDLHARAARWLEKAGESPLIVAEHHARSGDSDAAAPHWLKAIGAAATRGDSAQVAALSDRLLASSVTLEPAIEFSLLMRRGDALWWLRRYPDIAATIERLMKLDAEMQQSAPTRERSEMWRIAALSYRHAGERERERAASREAVRLADIDGSLDTRVYARAVLATSLTRGDDIEGAAQVAREAQQLATAGQPNDRARAAFAVAYVESMRGQPTLALRAYEFASTVAADAGQERRMVSADINAAYARAALGDFTRARSLLEEALEQARRLGLRRLVLEAQQNLGIVVARLGDAARGLALEREVLASAGDAGDSYMLAGCLTYAAIIQVEAGDAEGGLRDAARAVDKTTSHRLVHIDTVARAIRAQALVLLGRHAEALEESTRAMEGRRTTGGMPAHETELLLAHHDALVGLERDDEAADVIEQARERLEQQIEAIDDPALLRTFCENIAANRRLLQE